MTCKYCGAEMELIEQDDILGLKDYECSECDAHYLEDGSQYDYGTWSK